MKRKNFLSKIKKVIKSKSFKICTSIITASAAAGLLVVNTPKGLFSNNPHQVIKNNNSSLKGALYASADNSGKTDNPTSLSDDQLSKPDAYPYWLQYWGPWAQFFGNNGTAAKGTGGDNWGPKGPENVGCVATSIAIAMAKGGVKKAGNGSDFNPGSNQESNGGKNPYGQISYKTGDKGTITRDPKIGDCSPSGNGATVNTQLSSSDALAQCKKIADSGNYPLIRCNNNQHTVFFWKPSQDGKSPLFFDPARGKNFSAVKSFTYVGQMNKGQMNKFQIGGPGPVGGPNGTSGNLSGNNNGEGDNSTGGGSTQSQTGGAEIKPIFNPFYTPVLKNTPADQIGKDPASPNRAQLLQVADGFLPFALTILRQFMLVMIYFFAMLVIVGGLVKTADYWFGGIISDKMSEHIGDGFASSLIMPNGELFGISGFKPNEIWIGAIKKFLPIFIVLVLICSGTISRLIAIGINIFMKAFPHIASFIHII